jgi:DNA-directed RNA polymerase specialized sigma24 family protein
MPVAEARPAAPELIAAFLRRMRPRLLRFLARSRDALVELVVQWPYIEHPEAWLRGTLRNKCLTYFRGHQRGLLRRFVTVDSPEDLERLAGPASAPVEECDRRLDLARLVRALPARQQRLLWLYYGLGLSERELLEHLSANRPADLHTLRKDRWRAISRLRRALLERAAE